MIRIQEIIIDAADTSEYEQVLVNLETSYTVQGYFFMTNKTLLYQQIISISRQFDLLPFLNLRPS